MSASPGGPKLKPAGQCAESGEATQTTAQALEWLAWLLRARSGLAIGAEKHYLLESRLQPLLKREGLADLAALVERLRQPPSDHLSQEVVEAMTTNETLFFRDTRPFTHLAEHSLGQVAASRPPGQPVRIWSAGAASGQEAYSIAMVALENPGLLDGRPVSILGTDLATAPLQRARAGVYTQFEVQRGLSARRLVTHFDRTDRGWQIRANLRALCRFEIGNLLGDLTPLGTFDIIFCRNVMIYFDEVTKRTVLAALARRLSPEGWFYLGASETATGLCQAFDQHISGHSYYQLAR